MNDLSKYVPNVFFEQIPINNLVSSQEYQRNLSIKHVQKAAANFDLYQTNPVKVSRRDNINYVFNGQHTIEIVALVSGSRETPVWCMVYDDLEYQHEADIFANQMKYVKPLLPYEIFLGASVRFPLWWNSMINTAMIFSNTPLHCVLAHGKEASIHSVPICSKLLPDFSTFTGIP